MLNLCVHSQMWMWNTVWPAFMKTILRKTAVFLNGTCKLIKRFCQLRLAEEAELSHSQLNQLISEPAHISWWQLLFQSSKWQNLLQDYLNCFDLPTLPPQASLLPAFTFFFSYCVWLNAFPVVSDACSVFYPGGSLLLRSLLWPLHTCTWKEQSPYCKQQSLSDWSCVACCCSGVQLCRVCN